MGTWQRFIKNEKEEKKELNTFERFQKNNPEAAQSRYEVSQMPTEGATRRKTEQTETARSLALEQLRQEQPTRNLAAPATRRDVSIPLVGVKVQEGDHFRENNLSTPAVSRGVGYSPKATNYTTTVADRLGAKIQGRPTNESAIEQALAMYNQQRKTDTENYFADKDIAQKPVNMMSKDEKQAVKDEFENIPNYNVFETRADLSKNDAYERKQELYTNYRQVKNEDAYEALKLHGMTDNEIQMLNGNPLSTEEIGQLQMQGKTDAEIEQLANARTLEMAKARDKYEKLLATVDDSWGVTTTDIANMMEDRYANPEVEKMALESPVASSIYSLAANPIESAAEVGVNVYNYATGRPIQNYQTGTELIRNAITEDIDNQFGRTVYGGAMSIGDMAVAMGLAYGTGGGSIVNAGIQALEKAAQTMGEGVDRGLNPDQIFAEGIASGVTTYLTEKVPYGMFEKVAEKGLTNYTAKEIGKYLGSMFMSEGLQEASEDVADWAVDSVVAWDKNEFNTDVQNYISQGMRPEDAVLKAISDRFVEATTDFIIGGIGGAHMGTVSTGIAYGLGRINNNPSVQTDLVTNELFDEKNNNKAALNALLNAGKTLDSSSLQGEDAERVEHAKEIANKPIEQLTKEDIVDLSNVINEQANEANNYAKTIEDVNYKANVQNNVNQYKETGKIERNANENAIEKAARQQAEKIVAQNEKAQRKYDKTVDKFKTKIGDQIVSFSENFENEAAAKNFLENYENYRGINPETYATVSLQAYNAGVTGQSFDTFMNNSREADFMVKSGEVTEAYLKTLFYNGQNAQPEEKESFVLKNNENRGKFYTPFEKKDINEFFKVLAKKLDAEIIKTDDVEYRGRLDVNFARIAISEFADNEMLAAMHEVAEYTGAYNPEGYELMKKVVTDFMVKNAGEQAFIDVVNRYRDEYRKQGEKLGDTKEANKTLADAQDEVVNDFIATLLTTDEGFKQLAAWAKADDSITPEQKLTFFETIKQWLDNLVKTIKNYMAKHKSGTLGNQYAEMLLKKSDDIESLSKFVITQIDEARKNLTAMTEKTDAKTEKVTENEENSEVKHSYAGKEESENKNANVPKSIEITKAELNENLHIAHNMDAIGPVEFYDYVKKTRAEGAEELLNHVSSKGKTYAYVDKLGRVYVDNGGIKDILRHGKAEVSGSLVEAIIPVLENGKIVYADYEHKSKNYNTVTIVAPVEFKNDGYGDNTAGTYYVGVIVKRSPSNPVQNQNLHVVDILTIRKGLPNNGPTNNGGIPDAANLTLNDILEYVAADVNIFGDEGTIKFSLNVPATDSEGRKLSKGQQEYFSHSVIRDKNGNLKVMYHGTQNGGFFIFDPSFSDDRLSLFFADNKDVAKSYALDEYTQKFDPYNETFPITNSEEAKTFLETEGFTDITYFEDKVYGKTVKEWSFTSPEFGRIRGMSDKKFVEYAETVRTSKNRYYETYLNIENPLTINAEGGYWNRLQGYKIGYENGSIKVIDISFVKKDGKYQVISDYIDNQGMWTYEDIVDTFGEKFAEIVKNAPETVTFDNLFVNFSSKVCLPNGTRTAAIMAKYSGKDGVVIENVMDFAGGFHKKKHPPCMIAIAFDSNQVKSIYNENPTKNEDIRYSFDVPVEDTEGRKLTKGQQKYFKNSAIRDKNGNLKVMYHGTETGGFTIFNPDFSDDEISLFFTDSKDVAKTYSGTDKEIKLYKTVEDLEAQINDSYTHIEKDGDTYKVLNGFDEDAKVEFEGTFDELKEYVEEWYGSTEATNYKVYLNAENPLIIDAKGNNWDEIPEVIKGLTTTREYAEYAKENGYDSVIINNVIDSGVNADFNSRYKNTQVVVVFNANQVKSVDNQNPTENEDIRYSFDVSGDDFFDSFLEVDEEVKKTESQLKEMIEKQMDLDSDVSKKMISDVTSYIKKKYNSNIRKDSLEKSITAVFKYLQNNNAKMDDILYIMSDITKPMLQDVKSTDPALEKLYKDFVAKVKTYKIALDNYQRQEVINTYGTYKNFVDSMRGKITLDKKGVSLDSIWSELCDASGGMLSYGTNPNDEPIALANLINALNPAYASLEGQELEDASLDAALEIIRQFYVRNSLTSAAETIQGELTKRANKFKNEYKQRYNEALKQVEAEKALNVKRLAEEIDKLTAEEQEAIRNGDALNKAMIENLRNDYIKRLERLRAESNNKIARAKAQYRNAWITKNLNRERSELKHRVLREVKALQNMIAHPSEGATKHVPVNLIKPTIEMLEAINLDNGGRNKAIAERLKKMSEVYESFKNDEKYSFDYDERIANDIKELRELFEGKSYADLQIMELERVIEIVTALKTQIKNANNLILQGKYKDAQEAAKNAMNEVKGSRRYDNAATNALNRYGNIHLNAYREFRKLSGYKDGSLMEIYRDLDEGSHKEMQIQKDLGAIFQDVLEGQKNQKEVKKFISTKKEDLVDIGITDKNGKPILITRAMRMSLIMHSMNAGNMRHVLGSGITVPNMYYFEKGKMDEAYAKGTNYRFVDYNELLDAIVRNDQNKIDELTTAAQERIEKMKEDLSDWEKDFLADAERLFHDETGKLINETSMKLKGYALARVKNYFPIKTDPHFTSQDWSGLIQNGSLEGAGSLKERVISTKPILLEDITNVIERQIRFTSKYAGLAIAVRNFDTIMKQTSRNQANGQLQNLYETIDTVWGASDTKWLRNLMQDIQGGRGEKSSWLSALRGKFAGSTLALNPSVAFSQAASFPTAGAVLGFKPLMKSVKDIGKGFMAQKGIEELEKINPLLWYRSQGYATQDLADAKKATLPPGVQKFTKWIEFMDTGTVRTLEYASKYYVDQNFKNLKEGSEEYWQKVSEVFTNVVEQTQPNYSTLQRPDILRNPNSILKIFTMFKTQALQNFNIVYDAAGELNAAIHSGDAKWKKEATNKFANAVSSQVTAAVMFSGIKVLAQLMYHRIFKFRDDDDKWSWEKFIEMFGWQLGSTIAGSFMIGSQIYDFIKARVTDSRYYGIELSTITMLDDLLKNIESTMKRVDTLSKADTEAGKDQATRNLVENIYKMGESIGQFAGVPVSNIKNLISAMFFYGMDIKNKEISNDSDLVKYYTDADVPTQYERIYEAFMSMDSERYDKLVQELVDHEKANNKDELTDEEISTKVEENVIENITKLVKADYLEGELTKEETEDYLIDQRGKTEEEAFFQIYEWETGESKYQKLKEDIRNAALDPSEENWKVVDEQAAFLQEHGVEKGDIKGKYTEVFKDMYLKGELGYDDVTKLLIEKQEMSEDEAFFQIRQWETGLSKYDALKDKISEAAIAQSYKSWKAVDEQIDFLKEHGVEDGDIKSQYTGVFKDMYLNEEISYSDAMKLLMEKTDKDENEAYFTIRQWETGQSKNEAAKEALKNAAKDSTSANWKAVDKEINILKEHGSDDGDIKSLYTSTFKEMYIANEISYSKVEDLLMNKVGKDKNDAYFTIREWEIGLSDYGVLKEDITKASENYSTSNRSDVLKEIDNLLAHGKDKSGIAKTLTTEYKEKYIELYNKGKAADLNAILRAALVEAGYTDDQAKKKLNDWVK